MPLGLTSWMPNASLQLISPVAMNVVVGFVNDQVPSSVPSARLSFFACCGGYDAITRKTIPDAWPSRSFFLPSSPASPNIATTFVVTPLDAGASIRTVQPERSASAGAAISRYW